MMSSSFSLTQKVNFYISVAFILAFGIFMTTTVVNAINRDSPYLKYMSPTFELSQ
ncbi:MAG: hypothetical protein P4L81_03345 [Candidatus Pacebacteria bacterium]|nr:hypothetical protein [Candidatus Paceibacterota bacterium]